VGGGVGTGHKIWTSQVGVLQEKQKEGRKWCCSGAVGGAVGLERGEKKKRVGCLRFYGG